MMKRIFSLFIALCLIVGLLPAVAIPHAHAAVTTATVTLFGTSVTVDIDETTTDIPEARYWVNGEEGALPVAATAEDEWNYAFGIINDIPTVTLRNAVYKYSSSFLYGKYDGKLKVVYEGTNNITVPYSASAARYFLSFSASTNGASTNRQVYIEGAEDAVLNVDGGDNNSSMLVFSNKVYVNITGGTLNIEKTTAGGANAVIGGAYCKTTITNCNLTVKDYTSVSSKHPTVTLGYSGTTYPVTITNSNVTIKSNAHAGLCAGVYQSNGNGVLYPAAVIVDNSNVKIVNECNTESTATYNGVGIYATKLTVKNSTLEVEATKKAFHGTSTATPALTYASAYNMFTAKGNEAATEYVTTTYFKVAPCDHSAAEGVEEITKVPTCTEVGTKNITYTCDYGHTWTETAEIPATGHTEGETRPEIATDEFVTYCAVCGERISGEAATKLETAYSMVIDGTTRTITAYDIPLYLINKTSTGYYRVTKTVETTDPETGEVTTSSVTENVAGDYITQTSTGADASNYNAMLIWHTGDEGPTLYLRDFKLDHYNEELGGKWRMSNSTSTAERTTAGIHTGNTAPLKIVIESGECVIQNYEGIHYQNDLTIESADDASLSVFTVRTGILPTNVGSGYANEATLLSGNKLTLNANLSVSIGSFANSANSGYVIRTIDADMIINGGNIDTEYRGAAKSVCGIAVVDSGNLYVNGGTVSAKTYNTVNLTGAAYQIADDIYVTGGKVIAISQYQSGLRADNIYVSGGELDLDVYYGGLVVKANTGVISITDGVVKAKNIATTEYIFAYNYTQSGSTAQDRKIPEYGANVAITAGADEETAQKITNLSSFNYNVRYIKVEFVDAPACDHTNTTTTETIITNATCIAAGSKQVVVTCECGEVISDEIVEIAALGHKEVITTETKDATCEEAGSVKTTITCEICGETTETTEEIAALGHTEVEVKKVDATPEAAGHEAGTKCSVCGVILSGCEVIPKHLVEMIRVDGYDDIKASTDGRCAYLVNEPVEMTDSEGNTFMGSTWKVVGNWTWTEPAEWNVKYSFSMGGIPTLTLKGAILDHYNEATGKFSTAAAAYHNAIMGKTFENNDVYDLHIIIEENSTITTNGTLLGDGNGEYFHNVTIESVGDAKLTTRTAKGFAAKYGNLTVNANLEMEVPTYNGTECYPLYASGDITINGGNYKLSSSTIGSSLWAGSAGSLLRAGGNITINGGNIETNSTYYSTTGGVGAIQANGGEITINGGNITINHGVVCAFRTVKGTGAVIVNGGVVTTEGDYYAMGEESGIMKINGGTVEMYRPGGSAYYTSYPIDMSENPYWKAYAGTTKDDAKIVKEIPNTSRYIKIVSLEGEEPSCEHTNTTTTETIITNATCTAAGSKQVKVTCECGEVISDEIVEIAALGHKEVITTETKDATCTEAGFVKTTVTCENCGETTETTEEIAALGHKEVITTETKDATCTEAGYVKTIVTCENCGESTETTEEIAALGHKEVTTTETKDATCAEAGYVKTIVTCENCGAITETIEEIAATGKHQFDGADDSTCNTCDYVRPTAESLTLDANNKLVFVDNDETHIYHRVTVYYLGDKTVADITLTNPLKAIDPNAKTYWGIKDINRITLAKAGNYVIHLNYNTAGSPKYTIAKQFTITPETASAPTVELENGKLVVTEKNDNHIYHRAIVYYLGSESVSNIYDENALKAIDSKAKTYWGLNDINNVLLVNSGNYVVHLHYNTEGSAKMTVAEAFSVVASKPKITRNEYKLSVTDDDPTHTNHRVIVYFIGDANVDIYDEAALKELDPTATVRWGMNKINRTEMLKPGKYVIYLSYNLANGMKQTMVAKTTISLPVPSVWLEENGQIGTYVPTEVAHRNYVIYYLGDQTVDDIRDIDALNAIDSDPIKFDNQKQIAERGVLTEAGNYVLVMYYNYAGSNRQYISVFATLK